MVSWLFWLGNFFEPLGNAVRWPAVILGHATLLIWVALLANFLSVSRIKNWIYLVLFSPLLGFGSIIITPDIPVIFFWSFAMWAFVCALNSRNIKDYFILGLALGLGFCSKYHIVLFLPCLFAYLTFEKQWSKVHLKGVLVTLFAGLLFCAPVIIWNIQNDFASFEFQIKHGLEESTYQIDWTLSYILGQILILFPTIIYLAYKASKLPQARLLVYFAWIPLVFFLLTSFRALVEANWPIIAYPSLIALACLYGPSKTQQRIYFGVFGAAITIVIATIFIPSLRSINEKVSEPYHLQKIAEEVSTLENVYGSSYQISSSLWYFSKNPVYKLKGISRFDFFDSFEASLPQGQIFYLVKKTSDTLPSWLVEGESWRTVEVQERFNMYQLMKFERSL